MRRGEGPGVERVRREPNFQSAQSRGRRPAVLLPTRGRLTQQQAVNGLDLAVVLRQAEVLAYNDSVLRAPGLNALPRPWV